jgi:hypothetical protein
MGRREMKFVEIGVVYLAKTYWFIQGSAVDWSVWQWQKDGQHHMLARANGSAQDFAKCLLEDREFFQWAAENPA